MAYIGYRIPPMGTTMSLTKEQLAEIRSRAERDSGAWTGIVGEAIYDRRKLLVELDRLSRENSELRQNDSAMQRRLDEVLGDPRVVIGLNADGVTVPK